MYVALNPLDKYLFTESTVDVLRRSQQHRFAHSTLGTVELPRAALVRAITDSLTAQQRRNDRGPYNVYLYGMKGSGKTVLLANLAKLLQSEDYTVYFLETAQSLRSFSDLRTFLPEDESVKVAILIDEVNSNLTEGWHYLLKSSRRNLVTIAAGVVQYVASDTTAAFQSRIHVNLILSNEEGKLDKSQLQELIDYWKSVVKVDNVAIEDICEYLCSYCGGHFFSTASFSEYAFNDGDCQDHNKTLADFRSHFNREAFRKSDAFSTVKNRCLFL